MLTQKRERFVQHYSVTGNAAEAARLAGYSEHTAKQQGSRLMTYADVRAAVEAERARLQVRSDLRADDVIRGLRKIAEDESAKNSDRIRAYELLGKHHRLWIDRVETFTTTDVPELKKYSLAELEEMRALMTDDQQAIEGEVLVLE